MSIKLIASDLDGTLMSPDHLTVTKRTYNALKNASDKGIKIAVATGRPLVLIENVLEQIPFTDYVIYSNGACVYDRNEKKVVAKDVIEYEKAMETVRAFLCEPVFFEVYINGKSYYQKGTEEYYRNIDLPPEFVEAVMKTMCACPSLTDFMEKDGGGIEKITLYGVYGDNYKKCKDKLTALGLDAVSSLEGTIEATSPKANKGAALSHISESIGASPDEVMSFGDAGNDCPMLRFATYSFSMANGTDECKAAAKYAAKSNAEDGVAEMIEKYCLS